MGSVASEEIKDSLSLICLKYELPINDAIGKLLYN